MRKIDPFKIDLSKLAVSETGVPVGFRELLPKDIVQNGDIYDAHSGEWEWGGNFGERWRVQKHALRLEVGRGFYGPPENGWLKHYRVLEIPNGVPEGYGKVNPAATFQPGDYRLDLCNLSWLPVHPTYYGQPILVFISQEIYRLQPAFPVDTSPKKQFVFDRDYKSGCDKLQVKVDELTKRLRDEQTALGVRTEQLEAEQARSGDLRYVVNTLQQDLRDVRYALQASVQEAKQLEDRIETKDAIIKRTSDDCIALSNSLTESQVAQTKLNCEVSALNARVAEVTLKADHRQDMLAASAKAIERLLARIAELTKKDTGVGDGYRELRDDEYPKPGDEFSFATFLNLPRIWSYRGWPSTGPNETYGNLKRELGAGLQYRRKVAAF